MEKERIKKIMELLSFVIIVNEKIKQEVIFNFNGGFNLISIEVIDPDKNDKELFKISFAFYDRAYSVKFNDFIRKAKEGLKYFLNDDINYEISIKEKYPETLEL